MRKTYAGLLILDKDYGQCIYIFFQDLIDLSYFPRSNWNSLKILTSPAGLGWFLVTRWHDISHALYFSLTSPNSHEPATQPVFPFPWVEILSPSDISSSHLTKGFAFPPPPFRLSALTLLSEAVQPNLIISVCNWKE